MRATATLTVGVLMAAALLGAVVAVAPTASACGFEEDIAEVGPVFVALECTRPQVYVDGEPVLPPR